MDMGINRNIVECKVSLLLSVLGIESVLIETLWNVKLIPQLLPLLCQFVLIETLWNVKNVTLPALTPAACINRNIVECKV